MAGSRPPKPRMKKVQFLHGVPVRVVCFYGRTCYYDPMTHTAKQHSAYMQKWAAERMAKLRELKGVVCQKCGSNNDLHFHHRDPSTKSFDVAKNFSRNFELLLNEIDKCDLICHACHKEEHKAVHGLGMYSHQKCRCKICCDAWNAKTKEYKLKAKNKKLLISV